MGVDVREKKNKSGARGFTTTDSLRKLRRGGGNHLSACTSPLSLKKGSPSLLKRGLKGH